MHVGRWEGLKDVIGKYRLSTDGKYRLSSLTTAAFNDRHDKKACSFIWTGKDRRKDSLQIGVKWGRGRGQVGARVELRRYCTAS